MVGHQLVIRYYVVNFELKTKKACSFIKRETLAHVFSCEICEFLKIPVFKEHLQWLLLSIQKRHYLNVGFFRFYKAKMDMCQVFSTGLLSDLHSKSIDWFLYEGNTGTECVNVNTSKKKYRMVSSACTLDMLFKTFKFLILLEFLRLEAPYQTR